MSHASQESIVVAESFVKGEAKKSPLTTIGLPYYIPGQGWVRGDKGRRITTDGNEVLSYDWWRIAFRDGDTVWVTTDQYQTGEWKSGKPKYSPTTNGHIRAVADALHQAGYRETDGTHCIDTEQGEFRTYVAYMKE